MKAAADSSGQGLPATQAPLPKTIGKYEIVSELGCGGMARVFLGRTFGPGGFERLAAIKMIHLSHCADHAFVDMFLDEARIAARIHHPNVVPVYDVGEHEGQYFISMDYVNGETLALALTHTWKRGREFPLDVATHLMTMACDGLHAAHELVDASGKTMNVVHRDVSPQNILIGYDGILRVMDFGVAKAEHQLAGTAPGTHKGKYAYMAPEQLTNKPFDRRSDVYALGVVLWETTVGRRLFKAENDFATAQRVLHTRVPPPSTMRTGYPPELEAVILKATAREPDQRHASARELGQDLRRVLLSMQAMLSPTDIELFMKSVFPERHAERMSMLVRARDMAVVNVDRPGSGDSLSLSGIDTLLGNLESDEEALPTAHDTNPMIPRPDLDAPANVEITENAPRATKETVSATDAIDPATARIALRDGPGGTSRAPIVIGAIGVAGLAAVLFLANREKTPVQIPVQVPVAPAAVRTPPPPPPPPEPVEPPAPERVTISFDVKPANAIVRVDDKVQTGELVLEKSGAVHNVEITAPGHRPQTLSVSAEASRAVQVALEKIPPPPAPARPRAAAPAKKSKISTQKGFYGADDL